MTERDPAREADEFYVPTPEELEQGIETGARKRRGDRPQGNRHPRTSRASRARRLFRLRRGVGQKRTEAPAPTPIPSPVDPPPDLSRTQPTPLRQTEPAPSSRSSPSTPPRSPVPRRKPPEARSGRPVVPVEGGKPSSFTSSGQRLRRVAIPKRRQRPTVEQLPVPFPEYLLDKPKSRGHQFGLFEKNYSFSNDELYEGSCLNCGLKAIARHSAPENWTRKDAGVWDLRGAASDRGCTGGARATVG